MFWAMGALLLQFQAVPQVVVPAASGISGRAASTAHTRAALEAVEFQGGLQVQPAPVTPAAPPVSAQLMLGAVPASDGAVAAVALEPGRLVPTPVDAGASAAASASPAPAASPAIAPVIAVSRPPVFAARVGRGQQRAWLGLAIVQHSAATFDAWSTRRAITRGGAQELNPMLKPFAGNRSIYAAVQVAPTLLDYLGRRMMISRHGFLRRTWWLPQTLGTAASLAGGLHNLGGVR